MDPLKDGLFVLCFLGILISLSLPLGRYIARVLLPSRPTAAVLREMFHGLGLDLDRDMSWKEYTVHLLVLNGAGMVLAFLVQMFQHLLPGNPAHLPAPRWDLAVNTAISFGTNTNWQSYAGETAMSHGTQMIVMTVQNFLSAATGIAVFAMLVRGVTRMKSECVGNVWRDLGRITMLLLLPLSILWSVALMHEGVIQNFDAPVHAMTMEGREQILPQGPAASQVAIKQLGSNGGGFFGVNSAHPFENPTPLSGFLELMAIMLLPMSLVLAFGRMIGSGKEAWILWSVMGVITVLGAIIAIWAEVAGNPILQGLLSMEGKEVRFGQVPSVLWSVLTTATSNGSVNMMHSSLSPLAALVAFGNMMVGEVLFGGVGSGMYGMMLFIILTVFIAGLMVGRTPEYLGKRIEAFEVKMAVLAILAPATVILGGTAASLLVGTGQAAMSHQGPHGFSELLYAITSAGANNGSGFAGFQGDTIWHNLLLGLGMLIGRYGVMVPVCAIAGSLARKGITPSSSGTFRTNTPLFGFLLGCVILVVGGLTFFPALAIGPIAEHILIHSSIVW